MLRTNTFPHVIGPVGCAQFAGSVLCYVRRRYLLSMPGNGNGNDPYCSLRSRSILNSICSTFAMIKSMAKLARRRHNYSECKQSQCDASIFPVQAVSTFALGALGFKSKIESKQRGGGRVAYRSQLVRCEQQMLAVGRNSNIPRQPIHRTIRRPFVCAAKCAARDPRGGRTSPPWMETRQTNDKPSGKQKK